LYSDRGSHFWLTPKVGGKVDYHRRTQLGRALHELGVQMIPAYSPQARGRSERNAADQQRQLEQFEARKAQENAQIEAEMARVAAHYAERMKANLDQVASEREGLRNWQMAKQHEAQRIAEVIGLCSKSASEPAALSASTARASGVTPHGASGPACYPAS
jgi:hypothetical protein